TQRARRSTRSGTVTAASLRTLGIVIDEPQPAAGPRSLASQLFELTRHSAIYGVGGLVSRLLSVLMLPLYTSYVSTGDYGRIELLMAVMAVVVVLLRGRAHSGCVRVYFLHKDAEYRQRLIRTGYWAQLTYDTFPSVLFV